MSLETDVATLVTKTTQLIDYFNGKKAGIDAAVAAAIAAVPNNKKVFRIHQQNGLDTNDGSIGAPLKTLDKALANTPYGGICEVYLQSDYSFSADINGLEGRYLTIRTDDLAAGKRSLRPAYQLNGAGAQMLASFPLFSGAMLNLREVKIVLPTANGVDPVPSGLNNCLVRSITTSTSMLVGLKMTDCEVSDLAGATAYLVGPGVAATLLEVVGTTFPTGFGGRYILNVPGGTNPATLNNVLTNLPAL